MAFLDEISKRISSASEGVVNKGKAFADVARLNSALSEEEKKINNAYYQIGKLYVTLHPQDYEADFSTLINSIVSSQDKITSLKQQIQDIKGVTRCEKCGAEVQKNMAFCSACGSPMPKQEVVLDEDHIRCDGCGAIINKNLRFCTSCGKPLVKPVQSDAQVEPPASIDSSNETTCPSCGVRLSQDLRFCTACGYKLGDSSNDVFSSSNKNAIPVSNKRTCPTCGAVMDDELAFCTECGTHLN